MPPLVTPGGHRHSENKRQRRSPDRNGVSAKRQKVDNPQGRDVDQTNARPGKLAPAKPPTPTERRPTEQSSDPRRRKSEASSDPRKRPPEPPQNQKALTSTEPSSDPRLRRTSKPNIATMVPLSSFQQGGASTPITPVDVLSPSIAPRTSYFEPNFWTRIEELRIQIADKSTEVGTLAVASHSAKGIHEDLANTAPKRGSSEYVHQAQVQQAWEERQRAEAELKKAQDEQHRLIREQVQLERKLGEARDSNGRFSQAAATKNLPEKQDNKDDGLQALEARIEDKLAGHKTEISQSMDTKLEAKLTGAKAIIKTEIGSMIEQKLGDKMAALKTDIMLVIDKKMEDDTAALKAEMDQRLDIINQKLEKLKTRYQQLEDRTAEHKKETRELEKAGLTAQAAKKWNTLLEALDAKIKALEEEIKCRSGPLQSLEDDLRQNEKRTQALEGDLAKVKGDLSDIDRRENLSSAEADIKAIGTKVHNLEQAKSEDNSEADLEDLRSSSKALQERLEELEKADASNNLEQAKSEDNLAADLENLRSSSKALEERLEELEKADASNNLQADVDQLMSKIKILGDTLEKQQEASAASEDLRNLQAQIKALEERHELLQSAASTLDEGFKKLQQAVLDNDSRNDVQTLKVRSKVQDELIEKLQTTTSNSSNDWQSSLQQLEMKINTAQGPNIAQWPEDGSDFTHDLRNRVIEVEGVCTTLRHDVEWIHRCIDHRSAEFRSMPLYRAMCNLLFPSRHGGKGHSESCAPRELVPPDFYNYFDPATYEYKQTPLAAYLSDRFNRLEQDAAQHIDDRVKEVDVKIDNVEQSFDDRCKELQNKFEESEKVGDLWDQYGKFENNIQNQMLAHSEKFGHLPAQIEELGRKYEELKLKIESLPARVQEECHMTNDETLRCLQSVEEVRQRCDQLKQEIDAQNNKADGAEAPALSEDAIKEIASGEIRNFEKGFKILEAHAKQDGRRLKDQIIALEQAVKTDLRDQIVGLQQAVQDTKDLQIIKHGQGHLQMLSINLREIQENFLPKLSFLERAHNQLFPDLMKHSKDQATSLQLCSHQIGQIQLVVASMAKRFVPAQNVPPEWDMAAASANQGAHAQMMPARPHSAVQGIQYR
ncbi:hypothetical protein IWZ00DRAFT_559444 [Phyllosticta capitalensis]